MKYISYNVEHMYNDYNKLVYNIFFLKIILKNKFTDQTRPDQTRPDQTRPEM
ncbi:hypothetical protein [Brachyspira pilosicoli]|uniref:hypothetical protein n=1 Tax=Brachyspira pilosicoli TaxID=52584 RepID=UPI00300732DD